MSAAPRPRVRGENSTSSPMATSMPPTPTPTTARQKTRSWSVGDSALRSPNAATMADENTKAGRRP